MARKRIKNSQSNYLKPRVFISCGQRKNSPEAGIAEKVRDKLRKMGYEPYLAIEEQSLKGLNENIFKNLSTADYFLFIDFKREQFANRSEYRGSLYCNQELAIAAYIELDNVIAFQQNGLKDRDGMIGAMQLNPIPFKNRGQIPEMMCREVEKKWSPISKNKLLITMGKHSQAGLRGVGMTKFFHLNVENLSIKKIAIDCYAFVESIKDLSAKESISFKSVELKWDGYTYPNSTIVYKTSRSLDAFHVVYDQPKELRFTKFTDSSDFLKPLKGPGAYEITYMVISKNFPEARATFKIHIGETVDDIKFE